MTESLNPLPLMDLPEINSLIFHPRPDMTVSPPLGAEDLFFPVGPDISIGARFYLSDPDGPHLLFFHGNGEIASDYDDVGPLYQQLGLSLLAMDYRGYGKSQGTPSVANLLVDALVLFDFVYESIRGNERHGPFLVMGRSLGSASAIEIASKRMEKIAGLIIESGFAYSLPLLELIGISAKRLGLEEKDGFRNYQKISFITKPTLILHAQFDDLIPLHEAEVLLKNSGAERKEMLIIPGASHNDIMLQGGHGYFETIAHFAQSLKPFLSP